VTYQRSASSAAVVLASPEQVFELLDNPEVLGAHMQRPSFMMLGTSMKYGLDEAKGRAIGSVIRMTGAILGLSLFLEQVVIERRPPTSKTWETRGKVRLLVIGRYRMGFSIDPTPAGCVLNVRIDYDLPDRLPDRLLGHLLGGFYANWCVRKMADDACLHFGPVSRKP
jgi:hypothetical protein